MNTTVHASWRERLAAEFDADYFRTLATFVDDAYRTDTVYPPQDEIFAAFNRTPFDRIKVVILGQDPYHNPNQAHGLCFSVRDGVECPPSLVNIYRELSREYGHDFTKRSGDLTHWADQGVLMLNATLTVAGGANKALSHQGHGWERFTDAVLREVASAHTGLVYMLWGSHAQKKAALVDRTANLVLTAAHPSPLSAYRGFFGCDHFRRCNEYLVASGRTPIDW